MFKALHWVEGFCNYMLYVILKRCVFLRDLNNDKVLVARNTSGSLFQNVGEAWLKERAPYRDEFKGQIADKMMRPILIEMMEDMVW